MKLLDTYNDSTHVVDRHGLIFDSEREVAIIEGALHIFCEMFPGNEMAGSMCDQITDGMGQDKTAMIGGWDWQLIARRLKGEPG